MEYRRRLAQADKNLLTVRNMKSLGSWLFEFLLFGLGVIFALAFIASVMSLGGIFSIRSTNAELVLLLLPVITLVMTYLSFKASGAVARRRQGRVVVRKVVSGGSGRASGRSS
jgi:hypothetical protein